MTLKALLLSCLCALASLNCHSQGLVNLLNSSITLISVQGMPLPASQTYYFGLFIAPPGTTDRSAFVFTGLYATNHSTAEGRIIGGVNLAVPNWPSGERRSFLIRGWHASLGHDWQSVLSTGAPLGTGGWAQYGESDIAEGTAGGIGYPILPLFGSLTLQGFTLHDILFRYHRITLSAVGSPTPGGFTLRIDSKDDSGPIKIWSSTNGVNWLPLASVELTGDIGNFSGTYVDSSPPAPLMFYRASISVPEY